MGYVLFELSNVLWGVKMAELAFILDFLAKVHTAHTAKDITTTRNINLINDTQSILLYAGHILGYDGLHLIKQYHVQYKDATEAALNASIYALIEGIKKLNKREAIASYTRDTSLVGIDFLLSSKDYYEKAGEHWYANVYIIVKWRTS